MKMIILKHSVKSLASGIEVIGLLWLLFLFSSCYSYRPHLDKKQEYVTKSVERRPAFILNQSEFPEEYKILTRSKLYAISSDSTNALKLRLNKMDLSFWNMCYTGPVAFLICTLGQVPVRSPEGYTFEFEEVENNVITCMQFKLVVDRRIWFWDTFSWKKSLNGALAQSLRKEKAKFTATDKDLGKR